VVEWNGTVLELHAYNSDIASALWHTGTSAKPASVK